MIEIVGIAGDAKYLSLGEAPQPWLYRPLAQSPTDNPAFSLAVRTTGDPLLLRSGIEREVKALVPRWPSFQFRTLDESLELQRLLPRLGATLLGVLGGFGLLLAAIGMYGVMAYLIKQGMSICLIGAAIGIGVALLSTHFLSSVLYGVSAADPLTYVAVPCLLLGVALLACYLPARQIFKVNTSEVLRYE